MENWRFYQVIDKKAYVEYNIINWISNLHSKTIQFSKSQQLTPSETYFIDKQIHYLDMGQKK